MDGLHIVVIGAGVGGLAAALRLAARGVRVTVIEKNARVGGMLNLWEVPHPQRPGERPFRFDTGPGMLTLPFVFKDLFEAAGEDVRSHLPIRKLDPIARFIWPDGMSFDLHSDEKAMRRELQRVFPDDVPGWENFLARGRHIWNLAGEPFLLSAPEPIVKSGEFNLLDRLRMLTIPFRIGMFGKYSREVDKHIRSPRLREVLYQYATHSGANPFVSQATLAVIPFWELHFGGWHVEDGMYRIARELESVARKLGVAFRLNVSVQQINTERSRRRGRKPLVRSVTLESGEMIQCDAIVCNADVEWAQHNLIEKSLRPPYSQNREVAGSGIVLLLGVEGSYPQLAHHTTFMPDDYASSLRAMFESKAIPADPFISVCTSTRTDSSQAPDGCENLVVFARAPALDGTLDWSTRKQRYRDQLVQTLETKCGLTDLSRRIVVEQSWCPADFAAAYNANAGSIYGISSNGIRNAFLRPSNRDKRIAGLCYAGCTTHPGGGLPLVALSGKIASQMLCDDLKIDPT